MMDWYLAHDGGDLVVPKDDEYLDRLPSPDSWSQWGNDQFRNFEISQHEGDQCSFGSSIRGLSSQDSYLMNSDPCGCPDYHFGDLMETDITEDIFMSSLLQDESTSMMLGNESMYCDTDAIRNSKGFRIPSSVKVLDTADMLTPDSARYSDEDSSVEESVLLDLEAIMSQLNGKTRLCFRDSLYRLAHRSMQQLPEEAHVEEGLPLERSSVPETTDEQTSSERTGNAESRTNTIDRAVADLMFSKATTNLQNHIPDKLVKKTFAQDSEVPIFRQQNPDSPNSIIPSCDAQGLL